MLELSDHNFKAVLIKLLQYSGACSLESNEKIEICSKEIVIKKQMEIIDMEKYKTKIKTSWDFNY